MATSFWNVIMSMMSLKTNMGKPVFFVPVIILCLAGIGYSWLIHNFERKAVEIVQAVSPAAYNNRFLAAERYLQYIGKQAESRKGLNLLVDLPSNKDAIVLGTMPAGLSQTFNNNVYNWIHSGGHLLMVPSSLEKTNPNITDLAQRIGVRFVDNKEDSDCGCPPDTGADKKNTDEDELEGSDEITTESVETSLVTDEEDGQDAEYRSFRRLMRVSLKNNQIELEQTGQRLLEDTSATAVNRIEGSYYKEYTEEKDKKLPDQLQSIEREGAWLLRYRVGAGMVTILSETNFFTNDSIEDLDHAFLFSFLVQDNEKIWLVYSSNVDSIFMILWKKMPLFWISLLFTMVLVIWKLQLHSGPKKKLRDDRSHNILSHIEASGRYGWRIDRCRLMVEDNRKYFLSLWRKKKHGKIMEKNIETLDLAELAKKTGLTEQQVDQAFRLRHGNEQELIQSSQALQKFGLEIHGGEKKHND